MKRFTMLLLILVFVISGLWAAGGRDQGGTIRLRFAHIGVEHDIMGIFANEFAKRVQDQTYGRIVVEVFPNAALGGIEEMLNSVSNGTIDIGMQDFALLASFTPDMAVFSAPFIFRDAAHSMRVTCPHTSPVMQELNANLISSGGMRIIANCYRGARQLSANFPVRTPADLAGRRIRSVPLPIFMSMIRGMGATPTPVAFGELATALATGLADGQENPINTIYNSRLYEVQSHIMMTNHMQAIQTVFINERRWQSIPESDRRIIERISMELGNESVRWAEASDREDSARLRARGTTFIDVNDGLRIDLLREAVLRQFFIDFPQWETLVNRIIAIP